MASKRIIIGTRGSKLALWQAAFIKSQLESLHPGLEVEIFKIKTTGDKILDVPLAQVGGKGLFVKEIEEALIKRQVDIAVHSMKDVPTDFPDGLHLAVICKREDPRDAFISSLQNSKFRYPDFETMPKTSKIGTSSLRRSCQLLSRWPELCIESLRGNLDTRLRKLDEGQFDAIILAAAGVKRLGLERRITEVMPVEMSLPAIGQGAIGIECRIGDAFINELIAPLNDRQTDICVKAERKFLKRLEGGCQVPIAGYARIIEENGGKLLVMDGLVGSVSGDRIIRARMEGTPESGEHIGVNLAEDVLARGAKEILDEVYERSEPPINGEISS